MTKLMKNPKPEIRNPKQIPMTKYQHPKRSLAGGVWSIRVLNFEFVSDFELGIGDFPRGVVSSFELLLEDFLLRR
jgi:hypothetical protein